MAVFTFFFFDRQRPFRANLVQNLKIVSLRLNLVESLIRICRIQNDSVHCFRFRPEMPFLGKFGPKIQNYHFKLNLVASLIQIWTIQ